MLTPTYTGTHTQCLRAGPCEYTCKYTHPNTKHSEGEFSLVVRTCTNSSQKSHIVPILRTSHQLHVCQHSHILRTDPYMYRCFHWQEAFWGPVSAYIYTNTHILTHTNSILKTGSHFLKKCSNTHTHTQILRTSPRLHTCKHTHYKHSEDRSSLAVRKCTHGKITYYYHAQDHSWVAHMPILTHQTYTLTTFLEYGSSHDVRKLGTYKYTHKS